MSEPASQDTYDIRVDWGLHGLQAVGGGASAILIVDVLSFSTCVAIGCERGAAILPYRSKDASAAAHAQQQRALLAGRRGEPGFSLSPASLLALEPGTRLVLPSPNGSTLSLQAPTPTVVAGCLRNAAAVAAYLQRTGPSPTGPIAVIAAGEQWADGHTRFAIEDLIGAGAIVHRLEGRKSPEALLAEQAYLAVRDRLHDTLKHCASGRELVERGHPDDVKLAAELDAGDAVPLLRNGAYQAAARAGVAA